MIGLIPEWLNPDKGADSNQLVGSQQATHEFMKAMLRYLPEGTVGLFADEKKTAEIRREVLRFAENEGGSYHSAPIHNLRQLMSALMNQEITVLHNPADPTLHHLSYLRSKFSPSPFPLTGLTHGISYVFARWDVFAHLLLSPLLPCDSIICTSLAVREAFHNALQEVGEGLREAGMARKELPLRLDVIPLGVDVELFRPREREDARRRLGLPQNKIILLYFGRIDAATKGDINPLLLAFHELVGKHGSQITLLLAGGCSNQTMQQISQDTERMGIQNQVLVRFQPGLIERPLYYAAADVFVSPVETLQESFGLTPLEAMASGLPVVVSNWSGYRETVVHGKTGFHVDTAWADCSHEADVMAPFSNWMDHHLCISQSVAVDIAQLVQYLDVLISRPDQRLSMGIAAREHVVSCYRWEYIIEHTSLLWQELSAIAKQLTPLQKVQQHVDQPNSYGIFGHFASRRLTGSELIQITEAGQQAVRNKRVDMMQPDMSSVLNVRLLLTMLNFVRLMQRFRVPVSVDDVCKRLSAKHNMPISSMLSHTMWLIKYNLLRIA